MLRWCQALCFEAARRAGFDVGVLIAVAAPRGGHRFACGAECRASPELSSASWLKYNLLVERDTRSLPRVFVEYANLLDDWRREIARISAALAIDLSTRDEDAIEDFLTPDLRHQQHSGPAPELFGTDWTSTVYEALCAAARDEHRDEDELALDRVLHTYRASERGFRTASEDYRDHFYNNHVLLRPSLTNLIRAVVSAAHPR